jgi:hypothetical protein
LGLALGGLEGEEVKKVGDRIRMEERGEVLGEDDGEEVGVRG